PATTDDDSSRWADGRSFSGAIGLTSAPTDGGHRPSGCFPVPAQRVDFGAHGQKREVDAEAAIEHARQVCRRDRRASRDTLVFIVQQVVQCRAPDDIRERPKTYPMLVEKLIAHRVLPRSPVHRLEQAHPVTPNSEARCLTWKYENYSIIVACR